MKKITPFLWFNDQAEEAIKFYVSIFKNSKILSLNRSGKKFISGSFRIENQDFVAFNGGPYFTFSPAISLFVNCKTQAEVNKLWARLSKGGEIQKCGWLKDKFGISWQIIPEGLGEMLNDKNPEKARRVLEAMLQMDKINIQKIKAAHKKK